MNVFEKACIEKDFNELIAFVDENPVYVDNIVDYVFEAELSGKELVNVTPECGRLFLETVFIKHGRTAVGIGSKFIPLNIFNGLPRELLKKAIDKAGYDIFTISILVRSFGLDEENCSEFGIALDDLQTHLKERQIEEDECRKEEERRKAIIEDETKLKDSLIELLNFLDKKSSNDANLMILRDIVVSKIPSPFSAEEQNEWLSALTKSESDSVALSSNFSFLFKDADLKIRDEYIKKMCKHRQGVFDLFLFSDDTNHCVEAIKDFWSGVEITTDNFLEYFNENGSNGGKRLFNMLTKYDIVKIPHDVSVYMSL